MSCAVHACKPALHRGVAHWATCQKTQASAPECCSSLPLDPALQANAAFEQLPSLLEEEEEGPTALAAEHTRPPPRHRPPEHQSPSTSRLQVLTVRKRTAVVEQTELLRDGAGSLDLEGDIGIDLMPLESTDLADSGKVRHLELLGGLGSDAGDGELNRFVLSAMLLAIGHATEVGLRLARQDRYPTAACSSGCVRIRMLWVAKRETAGLASLWPCMLDARLTPLLACPRGRRVDPITLQSSSMLTSAQTLQQLSSASAKRLSGEQVPATNVMQDPGPSQAPSIQDQAQRSSPSSLHGQHPGNPRQCCNLCLRFQPNHPSS